MRNTNVDAARRCQLVRAQNPRYLADADALDCSYNFECLLAANPEGGACLHLTCNAL